MTTTFAASVNPATKRGRDSNFSPVGRLNDMTASRNPTPWTWHPHMPGVTIAWLADANGVSVKTISRWRLLSSITDVDLSSLTAELGLEMALIRPAGGTMPMWCRMAIAEFAWQGASYDHLAEMFHCGKSTIWRCVKGRSCGFAPLSGQRLLTKQQQAPIQS